MKEVVLAVASREGTGKGHARRVRMSGNIPAIIYGPQTKPVSVQVSLREFQSAWKTAGGSSAIYNLELGGKSKKVLIRELQRDPVTSEIVHVDFHAISMTKPIHLSVPIRLIGIPVGVKTDGGIMQTTMREFEIACLPADIPEHIDIDVESLHIGESIHVRDIKIEKAKILDEEQRTIVVISAPTVMKSTEEEAAEAAEDEAAAEEAEVADGTAEGAEGAKKEEGTEDQDIKEKDKKDKGKKDKGKKEK